MCEARCPSLAHAAGGGPAHPLGAEFGELDKSGGVRVIIWHSRGFERGLKLV